MKSLGAYVALVLVAAGCADHPQPTNPSFNVTYSQASASLEKMKSHPQKLPRPLVIVGGFLDPNLSAMFLKGEFQRYIGETDSRRIIEVNLMFCASFEDCRAAVIDAVQEACPTGDAQWTTDVDVVGVSLGGLVARYAAAPSGDAAHLRRLRIARLFSIGSPHSGARLAGLGFTKFLTDMQPGSAFLKSLASCDSGAAYELYPYVLLGDEIVGVENAAPPGRAPLWLAGEPVGVRHFEALTDPRILADIASRLRGDSPFSSLPASPLPN